MRTLAACTLFALCIAMAGGIGGCGGDPDQDPTVAPDQASPEQPVAPPEDPDGDHGAPPGGGVPDLCDHSLCNGPDINDVVRPPDDRLQPNPGVITPVGAQRKR